MVRGQFVTNGKFDLFYDQIDSVCKVHVPKKRLSKKEVKISSKPGSTKEIFGKMKYRDILGDPGADSGDEGKSKRAEKYGAKKSKERREEPLGTMSYQTSSKRSPPFWLLIGARKLLCFSAQSEASRPMGRFVYPYME